MSQFQEGVPAAKLIFCERLGDWAFHAKRILDLDPGVVLETRALVQVEESLAASPASIVGVEVDEESIGRIVRWTLKMRKRFPHAVFFSVGRREMVCWRPYLIESGMIFLETSPRNLTVLRSVMQNHLPMASRQDDDFRRELLSRLPWSQTRN